MAPELLANRNYQLQVVDWFALGVMIFMMYTGKAPFVKADLKDPYFNLIGRGDMNKFWKAH